MTDDEYREMFIPLVDYLKDIGCDKQKHSGGSRSLLHHLVAVSILLSERGCSDDLCKAGLFHSIYGTEYYNFDAEKITREEIKKQIGEKSESLVYEFCSMTNRVDTILNSDNIELKQIEFCNLLGQNTHGQYGETLSKLSEFIFTK